MRAPPGGFSEDGLVRVLAEAWRFVATELRYAPVGFGSHHWIAADATGAWRFVSVDVLDQDGASAAGADRLGARFAGLRSALQTARLLLDRAQLSIVVAPLLAIDGSVRCALDPIGWPPACAPAARTGWSPTANRRRTISW